MAIPSTAELTAAAEAIAPTLAAETGDGEQLRSVSKPAIDAMTDAGLWRILTPQTFGGWEAGLRAQVETLLITAAADSSAGWVQMVINAHAWIVGNFPEQCQDEVFDSGPDTRVPGTLGSQGRATKTSDGWQLDGRWQFASGVDHGDWLLIGATTDAEERAVHAMVPKRDIEVDDTWHTLGLRGTGSKDLVAEAVTVPAHRMMPTQILFNGISEHGERHATHFNRLPVITCLIVQYAAAVIGIATTGVQQFTTLTADQKDTYLGARRAERPGIQMRVAESMAELDTATLSVRAAASRCDEVAATGNRLTMEERAEVKWRAVYASEMARRAIDRVYAAAGAHSIYNDSEVQRRYRDVTTATHHALADFDTTAEMFGRTRLGLSPGTPLV